MIRMYSVQMLQKIDILKEYIIIQFEIVENKLLVQTNPYILLTNIYRLSISLKCTARRRKYFNQNASN